MNDLPRPLDLKQIEEVLAGAPMPGLLPLDQLIEPMTSGQAINLLKLNAVFTNQLHGLWMNENKLQIEICNMKRRQRDLGAGGPLPYTGSEHGQVLARLLNAEETNSQLIKALKEMASKLNVTIDESSFPHQYGHELGKPLPLMIESQYSKNPLNNTTSNSNEEEKPWSDNGNLQQSWGDSSQQHGVTYRNQHGVHQHGM